MKVLKELHAAVSAGFTRFDERLERVATRLTNVETELTAVKGEVSSLQRWRDAADARFDRIDERLVGLELHIAR